VEAAGLTVTVKPTDCPCGIVDKVYPVGGVRVSVVVVGVKLTEDHLFTKFAALTVPRPVARSYPGVVTQAG
jgi:hypothetical protein